MRTTFLALCLVLGAASAAAEPAGEPARTHDRILRGLGLEPGFLSAKEASRLRSRPQAARPGMGEALRALRTRPFLVGRPVYDESTISARTRAAVEGDYTPYHDPAIRPADPASQRRVHSIYWRLASRLRRELGVRKSGVGPALVLEGGRAEAPGAVTLTNGSIIVHQASLEMADRIAAAILSSRTKRELMGNVLSLAFDRVPPEDRSREARAIADGILALTTGHEMGHALKKDLMRGTLPDVRQTPMGPDSAQTRGQELVADAAGGELALRSGFSPTGILAFYLYRAVLEAQTGQMNAPRPTTHPRGLPRYELLYRMIMSRENKPRLLYDGVHRPGAGPVYLGSAEAAAVRAVMPSPDELREYLLGLAHGMGYVYQRRPQLPSLSPFAARPR